MTTYVFDFCNLYHPDYSDYNNDEYNIRIEPLRSAEIFEDERTDFDSQFRNGYWKTAKCYIEAEEDRAVELAEWLSFIYSFAQGRDVLFTTYYPYTEGYDRRTRRNTFRFSMDNTNHPIIYRVVNSDDRHIGDFVDRALDTLNGYSDPERKRVLRYLTLYLQAEEPGFWGVKFIFHWILLESAANHNYDMYLQGPGQEIFSEDEIEELRESIIGYLEDDWDEDQISHLDYILGQGHLYEASSKTKIRIYLEHLDIGFDLEEVAELLDLARGIRNSIFHRFNDRRLMNNNEVVIQMRKISIYVILRLLGVDRDLQDRLMTPTIIGPDIE